jgi:hypothetical protein
VTYLVKYECPDVAIFYAMARLAKPHKICDSEPCALSKEPAAEDGLRAHDRHLIAMFRSAHYHC